MIEIIETQAHHTHGLALIDASGGTWITFARPWWDIASWLWWVLTPGEKKYVQLRHKSGRKVRIRSVQISNTHVRIGHKT